MAIIKRPHDKFFKEIFGKPEVMKDFLQNYLPAEILAIIDIKNLTLENNSFIDEELSENYSDLLFKTGINQKESYIYLLFEHKSYLSQYTSLQLLKYMIKIWDSKAGKEKNSKLPLIIPLVIYHGREKWQIDANFIKIIEGIEDLPSGINKYIPDYEYVLYDLTTYEAEKLKGNIILTETIKIMQAIFHQDINKFKEVLAAALLNLENQDWAEEYERYFFTYIIYILNARPDLELEDIYEVSQNVSPERSGKIMTLAEKLYNEGMEKGMEKGIEKGIEKGRLEGKLEGQRKTAKNFLRLGLSPEQVAEAAELPIEEILQLKKEIGN
ncbi:MAG: Rpn family recombination-promoting nuclease/putative transposase [Syntrophomonadaceae bacterium]|nr:Rpn family recombination-promoting nuclease/putative transposase [Syntrophomonadaceae bacterium]